MSAVNVSAEAGYKRRKTKTDSRKTTEFEVVISDTHTPWSIVDSRKHLYRSLPRHKGRWPLLCYSTRKDYTETFSSSCLSHYFLNLISVREWLCYLHVQNLVFFFLLVRHRCCCWPVLCRRSVTGTLTGFSRTISKRPTAPSPLMRLRSSVVFAHARHWLVTGLACRWKLEQHQYGVRRTSTTWPDRNSCVHQIYWNTAAFTALANGHHEYVMVLQLNIVQLPIWLADRAAVRSDKYIGKDPHTPTKTVFFALCDFVPPRRCRYCPFILYEYSSVEARFGRTIALPIQLLNGRHAQLLCLLDATNNLQYTPQQRRTLYRVTPRMDMV